MYQLEMLSQLFFILYGVTTALYAIAMMGATLNLSTSSVISVTTISFVIILSFFLLIWFLWDYPIVQQLTQRLHTWSGAFEASCIFLALIASLISVFPRN